MRGAGRGVVADPQGRRPGDRIRAPQAGLYGDDRLFRRRASGRHRRFVRSRAGRDGRNRTHQRRQSGPGPCECGLVAGRRTCRDTTARDPRRKALRECTNRAVQLSDEVRAGDCRGRGGAVRRSPAGLSAPLPASEGHEAVCDSSARPARARCSEIHSAQVSGLSSMAACKRPQRSRTSSLCPPTGAQYGQLARMRRLGQPEDLRCRTNGITRRGAPCARGQPRSLRCVHAWIHPRHACHQSRGP